MKGKEKCRILKDIRRRIAEENGIEYVTSECKHKGDCRGTCPKCEQEVRDLERELERRMRLGKGIAIAGIAATMVLTGVGCADIGGEELGGDIPAIEETDGILAPEQVETPGEVPDDDVPADDVLMGEPEWSEDDVPYIDENGNEAIGPEIEEIAGVLPETFFPDTPEGYDDYSKEFIDMCLQGMTITQIKDAWGEEDMGQVSGDRGIIAYFTEAHDIVIQYWVNTKLVINVTTIENDA